MSNILTTIPAPPTPPLEATSISTTPATVTLHALSAGHLTLPEKNFVHPASDAKSTVPSLAFLIQHHNSTTGKLTRILFDLGLRRDLNRYSEAIKKHAATRNPISTDPDVVKSLRAGGLGPDDIDFVIFSHVHWDHIGEPLDFPTSTFVVGHGALSLLNGTSPSLRGGHSFFEADLLPQDRTIELSHPSSNIKPQDHSTIKPSPATLDLHQSWAPHLNLPSTLDIFHDSSLYIVNAPGHLPGHVNLLARVSPTQLVYLAGDSCHDRRILRHEREIGTWLDGEGYTCCIHADRKEAEETIEKIRGLESMGVEVIFAHDVEWEGDVENEGRFWGRAEGAEDV